MLKLHSAIATIRNAAKKPALPLKERTGMLDAAIRAMGHVLQTELNDALIQLIPALDADDAYSGGVAAMAIGALLESGATPSHASVPLRAALANRMREASTFAETWKAGQPPSTDVEHIEAFYGTVNEQFVDPDDVQRWAARDPKNARTWSRMDDWFLPIMALARMDEACRNAVVQDEDLRQAYERLKATDPSMFLWGESGNSTAGTYFEKLMIDGAMPTFADELPEPTALAEPAKVLNDIAAQLYTLCDQADVVVRVEMAFKDESPSLMVVRHVRDPANLFDCSKDTNILLPQAELRTLQSLVKQYKELDVSSRTTLSVYSDGTWSLGSMRTG